MRTALQTHIAALRKTGLTFEQIADQWGVNTSTVWRWNEGKTVPNLVQIKSLAKKTGLAIAQLM
jgi:DNA-binding transcriptional regulator YiaG